MTFNERNLSDQYISSSYQDILQQYTNTGSFLYVLDGYGNVVFAIPSASVGQILITNDITSSMTVLSASYALTADTSLTSDFALQAGNTLYTASYALTASVALNAGSTATYTSSLFGTASWALSASNVIIANPFTKIGLAVYNGTASTFMRSDAAPALDQTISPSWFGNHLFNARFGWGVSSTTILASGSTTYTYIGVMAIKLASSSSNAYDHQVYLNAPTQNGEMVLFENVGTGSLVLQHSKSSGDGTMTYFPNGDWVAKPHDQILLRYNGSYWTEICRNNNILTSSYSLSSISASYGLSSSYASWATNALGVTGSLSGSSAICDAYIRGSNAFNYQTVAYTLTSADDGRFVVVNASTNTNVVVSSSLSTTFTTTLMQSGSGKIQVVPQTGVNIRNRLSQTGSAGQYAVLNLFRVTSGDFILSGDTV